MSEPAVALSFTTGVDLGEVQKRLQEEREKRALGLEERVCTMNLVGCYFSEESYERARPALEAACALHPARLIVLVSSSEGPDAVRGSVDVARAGSSVAMERVVLSASGAAVRHLRPAMMGLLVPELPVVIVWGGRPEGALFEQALESADRVIVDSATRDLATLAEMAERVHKGAPVGDLAWARLFPWQATAAEMLDLPNLREHRGRIRAATVTAAGQPGAEAALLAGWFASRLPRAKVELLAGPLPAEEQEAAAAGVRAPPLHEGQIALASFEAPPALFTIRRERGILVAEAKGDDDGEVVHRVRLPAETPGRLLGLELKLLAGADELYAASLKAAAHLIPSGRPG